MVWRGRPAKKGYKLFRAHGLLFCLWKGFGGCGFCRERDGDGCGVSSCKGMFEAAGLLSFADGRIYVFFITEARQPQRPVFGPCMAVWESLWSGMPYFILL